LKPLRTKSRKKAGGTLRSGRLPKLEKHLRSQQGKTGTVKKSQKEEDGEKRRGPASLVRERPPRETPRKNTCWSRGPLLAKEPIEEGIMVLSRSLK